MLQAFRAFCGECLFKRIRHGPQVESFSTGQAAPYSGLRLRALSVPSLQLSSQKLCSAQPEAPVLVAVDDHGDHQVLR